jgi:hypothetical protein
MGNSNIRVYSALWQEICQDEWSKLFYGAHPFLLGKLAEMPQLSYYNLFTGQFDDVTGEEFT